jgi:hypothetical protein
MAPLSFGEGLGERINKMVYVIFGFDITIETQSLLSSIQKIPFSFAHLCESFAHLSGIFFAESRFKFITNSRLEPELKSKKNPIITS